LHKSLQHTHIFSSPRKDSQPGVNVLKHFLLSLAVVKFKV